MTSLREAIPALARLLDDLDQRVRTGAIEDTEAFTAECRRRWDEEMMGTVDAALPGWAKMASFADGKTLWHVTIAMVALLRLDEYLGADEHERQLMEWTVLLHDIAKEPTENRRDHLHAFRSAAVAARLLPGLGFATTPAYPTEIDQWHEMVFAANRYDEEAGEPVSDNRFLADILDGIDRMFGPDGARLLKAIAMHQSVTVLEDWPSLAPLTPEQEVAFIPPGVASLQLPLMLADSGGWNLFDPPTLEDMYADTRRVFVDIAARRQ